MSIILVTGKSGSGKSTLSKYIVDNYDSYIEVALADKLKQLTFKLLQLFNVKIDSIDDLYNVNTKNKYRKYLQNIGTECCRDVFGDDFWCDMLKLDLSKNIIISDIRYANEMNYFMNKYSDHDIISIKVVKKNSSTTFNNHSSELDTDQLQTDFTIENDFTDSFFKKIDDTLNDYLIRKLVNSFEKQEPAQSLTQSLTQGLVKGLTQSLAKESTQESMQGLAQGLTQDLTQDLTQESMQGLVKDTVRDNDEALTQSLTQDFSKDEARDLTQDLGENEQVHDKDNETYKLQYSSYSLGRIGENDVWEIIERIRPEYETTIVSSTGHLADIHSIDYNNNIKYIIEIKLKQQITKEDVNKFDRDLENAKHSETSLKIIGLFISLNSDKIPSIGSMKIFSDKIYLTRNYFSENSLDLIFRLIETYSLLIEGHEKTNVHYEISSNVLELVAKLRAEYVNLTKEMEMYLNMKNNTEQNLLCIQELIGRLVLKEQFIKFINTEFSDILPTINDDLISKQENDMRAYIQSTSKKSIKKKDLLNRFPALSTKIGSMKINDLINEYKQ